MATKNEVKICGCTVKQEILGTQKWNRIALCDAHSHVWNMSAVEFERMQRQLKSALKDGCVHMGDGRVCGGCMGSEKLEWAI